METPRSEFFLEIDECLHHISILETSLSINHNFESLQRLRSIFDSYLECPTLLDPHLGNLITKLSFCSLSVLRDLFISKSTEENISTRSKKIVKVPFLLSSIYVLCKVRGRKVIQKFLPHHVDDLEPILYALQSFDDHIANFRYDNLPDSWETRFVLLIWLEMLSMLPFALNSFDSSLTRNGENEARLLQRVIGICKLHLSDTGPTRDAASSCLSRFLTRPDINSQGFLEDFIVKYASQILQDWEFNYSCNSLEQYVETKKGSARHQNLHTVLGVIGTLVNVFKIGSRANLIDFVPYMKKIWRLCILLAQGESISLQPMVLRKLLIKLFARVGCAHLKPRLAGWRYERGKRAIPKSLSDGIISPQNETNTLSPESKKTTATQSECTEISSFYFEIPHEIEDVVSLLLRYLNDPSTNIRYTASKNLGRITERLPHICAIDVVEAVLCLFTHHSSDTSWHGGCLALAELARRGLLLPNDLEPPIQAVLKAMRYDKQKSSFVASSAIRDSAAYACWAFSRAYSADVLAPYIRLLCESMICMALFDREVNCRRAASAAFQEFVGRMGGINVACGIEIITAADFYALGNREEAFRKVAVKVAAFSLGNPHKSYRRVILDHVANFKIVHWDYDVRVLASKALSDLCLLDVQHSMNVVFRDLIRKCTNQVLIVRHGAVLGVGELLLALKAEIIKEKKDNDLDLVRNIVISMEEDRLYRGRGGEIMREAVSRLIECISLAQIPLSVKHQVRLLDSIDANLKHPCENIQKSASKALFALTRSYFPVGSNGPTPRLQKRIVDKYIGILDTSDVVSATRGYSMAIGSLPKKLLSPNAHVTQRIVDCLCRLTRKDTMIGVEPDAETRRNSIISLNKICNTIGIENGGISKKTLDQVFKTLLACMEDYSVDRRGDTGSWSRIAAMTALMDLSRLAVLSSPNIPQFSFCNKSSLSIMPSKQINFPPICSRLTSLESKTCIQRYLNDIQDDETLYFDDVLCAKIVSAYLKQLAEKLDTVRSHAGRCLEQILISPVALSNHPIIPFIPQRRALIKALSLHSTVLDSFEKNSPYKARAGTGFHKKVIDWGNPSTTFPIITNALNIKPFTGVIITGLVISVGGFSGHICKIARLALKQWIQAKTHEKDFDLVIYRFGKVLLKLFHIHSKESRVITPTLKTIEYLLTLDHFDALLSISGTESFLNPLLDRMQVEATQSKEVKMLFAIVEVAIAMLSADDENFLKEKLFPFVLHLMRHRYPRIRAYTAELLYVKFMEKQENFTKICYNYDSAISLLLNIPWREENLRAEFSKLTWSLGVNLELVEAKSLAGGFDSKKITKIEIKDQMEEFTFEDFVQDHSS